MDKVYILQEGKTRDGLNFDSFAKDKKSLKVIAEVVFKNRFYSSGDELPSILRITAEYGGIHICYIIPSEGVERVWNNYSYIEVPVI